MRVLVVMDPVSTVQVDADTSFALMLEAQARGHRVDHALASDLELLDGRVFVTLRRATMQRVAEAPILLGEPERVDVGAEIDAVLIRKDPPFDSDYLWLTLLLERLRDERTLVVNDPRGLRDANEKLYACHFPELTPRTLVSGNKARIKEFVAEVGGRAVIKPVDGHGGEGVFALLEGDKNFNGLVEHVTRLGRRLAMVQSFIPEVTEGDKRILLIDGEVVGAILRVPQKDDVRSNIHVGGSVKAAELTDADRHIVATVTPKLRADGLYFVGLDVIGGKLTEVNVTSPTGIQQMSRFAGRSCETPVIAWLESRVAAR
ncbi:MAG: glutathione synthase [Sandaracinus sp.]|nr:glutathione synthase [Sandaracinus sp.]